MKTKLLRKVRKRFEINYYPNGYYFTDNDKLNSECVVLIDNSCIISSRVIYKSWDSSWSNRKFTKEVGYKECYEKLKSQILHSYEKYGTRRNKKLEKIEEKLWYQKHNLL